MKKILILTTGGTIASTNQGNGLAPTDITTILYQTITNADFLSHIKIDIHSVFSKDSSNIIPKDWDKVANTIKNNLSAYDGVVILHGTDTMSYSAAMLSYLFIGVSKPIVLTGSQKPIIEKMSDGVINFLDAVSVAADDRLAGVFVVFHDKIINGTRAYKRSSVNLDAYISCNYPYVGVVKENQVYLTQEYCKEKEKEEMRKQKTTEILTRIKTEPCTACEQNSRIFLLKMTPGFHAVVLDYLKEEGYKGIVIEGFGLGGMPVADKELTRRIHKLIKKGIPLVMSTQCVYDGVNLNTYEVGMMAEKLGIISAKDMTSEAVYTKLMWILSMTDQFELIKEALQTNFCGEIQIDA